MAYTALEIEEIEVVRPREGMPLILDDWSLAFRLGVSGKLLWYLIIQQKKNYKIFRTPKSSGGMRTIFNPNAPMKKVSNNLRQVILKPLCSKLGPHVGAYQEGRSTTDSAKRHIRDCSVCDAAAGREAPSHDCPRRGVKIHLDLKDFFMSTKRAWVIQYFRDRVGFSPHVSELLAGLLTVRCPDRKGRWYGVPQGFPASGDICNLIADLRLDGRIQEALPDWVYTRYADDIYLSHAENLPREEVDRVLGCVYAAVKEAGYAVNHKKTHVQRPGKQQRILGLTVNQKVNIPRSDYRRVRAILHNCYHHGVEAQLAKAKKDTVPELLSWLEGMVNYFHGVNPEKTAPLRSLLKTIQQKEEKAA